MSEQFLSEIRIMSFNYPPKGWSLCNGQTLAIAQNQALFSLLGTTFGGNGQTTFALPNFQGRTPIHMGNNYTLGAAGGEQNHTLTPSEMPTHSHTLSATAAAGSVAIPGNTVALASSTNYEAYGALSGPTTLVASTIGTAGGSQPHNNMQPYSTLSFCIALVGIFPSQN